MIVSVRRSSNTSDAFVNRDVVEHVCVTTFGLGHENRSSHAEKVFAQNNIERLTRDSTSLNTGTIEMVKMTKICHFYWIFNVLFRDLNDFRRMYP